MCVQVVDALVARNNINPTSIDDVIFGCVSQVCFRGPESKCKLCIDGPVLVSRCRLALSPATLLAASCCPPW